MASGKNSQDFAEFIQKMDEDRWVVITGTINNERKRHVFGLDREKREGTFKLTLISKSPPPPTQSGV
jgi:hypothetical protein